MFGPSEYEMREEPHKPCDLLSEQQHRTRGRTPSHPAHLDGGAIQLVARRSVRPDVGARRGRGLLRAARARLRLHRPPAHLTAAAATAGCVITHTPDSSPAMPEATRACAREHDALGGPWAIASARTTPRPPSALLVLPVRISRSPSRRRPSFTPLSSPNRAYARRAVGASRRWRHWTAPRFSSRPLRATRARATPLRRDGPPPRVLARRQTRPAPSARRPSRSGRTSGMDTASVTNA